MSEMVNTHKTDNQLPSCVCIITRCRADSTLLWSSTSSTFASTRTKMFCLPTNHFSSFGQVSWNAVILEGNTMLDTPHAVAGMDLIILFFFCILPLWNLCQIQVLVCWLRGGSSSIICFGIRCGDRSDRTNVSSFTVDWLLVCVCVRTLGSSTNTEHTHTYPVNLTLE